MPEPHFEVSPPPYSDDEEELQRIKKLPKEERRGALEQFKEKFLRQREGLAKLQVVMIEKITENPEIALEDLEHFADEYSAKYTFNHDQMAGVWDVMARFSNRRDDFKAALAAYPDSRDMFRSAFGRDPQGKVRMVKGPVSLGFICDSADDFALIYSGSYRKGEAPTEEDLKHVRQVSGAAFTNTKNPMLQNGIIAVNNSLAQKGGGRDNFEESKATLLHEEQHALDQLFEGSIPMSANRGSGLGASFEEAPRDDAEIEKKLYAYLRYCRSYAEAKAKSEILSYMREGGSPDRTFENLMTSESEGGIYDYNSQIMAAIVNEAKRGRWHEKYKAALPTAEEKILGKEYERIINAGIGAFLTCRDTLKMPLAETLAFLEQQPLIFWPGAVARLERMKKGESTEVDESDVVLADEVVADFYDDFDDDISPKKRGMGRRK